MFIALAFTLATLAALVLTPLAIHLATLFGVLDHPHARKSHRHPTPRTGGLAIAAAMILAAAPVLWLGRSSLGLAEGTAVRLVAMLCASLFVLGVGAIDDVRSISSKYKLLALVAASCILCGAGVRIEGVIFSGQTVHSFGWLAWPITVLWIVGVTVSLNFIDGLDGLAGGLAAIAATVLAIGAGHDAQLVPCVLALALLGSLLGFLYYNFEPAKVFMGDSGSMFVGFTLAASSVLASSRVSTMVAFVVPALPLAIPFLDAALTLVRRRVLQRRSVFSAERGHIHHRLLDLGLCPRHAVYVLWAVSLAAACVGLIALFGHRWATIAGLTLLVPLWGGLFRVAGSMRARETVAAIRRNRALGREVKRYRDVFEEMQLRLRNVRGFTDWWTEICRTAELLDFTRLTLPLINRDGSSNVLRWARADRRLSECECIRAQLPLRQRRTRGIVYVDVHVAAPTFLESAGQRISLFSRVLAEHSLLELVNPKGPRGDVIRPPATESPDESAPREHLAPLLPIYREVPPEDDAAPPAPLQPMQVVDDHAHDLSAKSAANLRIAIVHDFLYVYAGAERVLEQLIELYPQADLFSLFDFVPKAQRGFLKGKSVRSTFIQRMPFARRKHRAYLPLMPLAIEQLDVSKYDIVISSSYVAAKGILTRPDQLHVCYCHSPARFAWDLQHQYLAKSGLVHGIRSLLARMVLHYFRTWDVRTSNGVDVFVTNSRFVGRRVEKIYRRKSATIYPPVDTARFTVEPRKEDFYLTVSRMVPYKRMDLIIESFSRMPDRRLIVVGEGPDFDRLRAKAGPNVKLIGHQSAERLTQYLQMARAFIFAAEEDFGIAPVEAQACGTPVIAFGRGGATESIVDGETGVLFAEQTVESLSRAVDRFESIGTWDAQRIRRRAECFAPQHFRRQFAKLVEREWARFKTAITDGLETVAEQKIVDVPLPAIDPRTLDLDRPIEALDDNEVLTAGDE